MTSLPDEMICNRVEPECFLPRATVVSLDGSIIVLSVTNIP